MFSGKVQGAPRIVERALVWRWPTRRVDALATNDSPAAVMFIVAWIHEAVLDLAGRATLPRKTFERWKACTRMQATHGGQD